MEARVNANNEPWPAWRSDVFDSEIAPARGRSGRRLTTAARRSLWIVCWLFASLAMADTGTVTAASSGVHGTVSLSPSCPGALAVAKEPNCRSPYGDVQLHLMALNGRPVATARSSAAGRFQVLAPAGHYRLQVRAPAKPVRCPITEVVVIEGRLTLVDIDCDSGMR